MCDAILVVLHSCKSAYSVVYDYLRWMWSKERVAPLLVPLSSTSCRFHSTVSSVVFGFLSFKIRMPYVSGSCQELSFCFWTNTKICYYGWVHIAKKYKLCRAFIPTHITNTQFHANTQIYRYIFWHTQNTHEY